MPFSDYTELVETIARWLARKDLKSDVPAFIQLFEANASRDLGIREQEQVIPGALIAGQEYIDLPDDCLWPRHLVLKERPIVVCDIVASHEFSKLKDYYQVAGTSKPLIATHVGNQLRFGRTPSAANTYDLWYVSGLPPLGEERKTNQVLKQAPDCYLYGSLLESAPFLGHDDRLATWGAIYGERARSYRMMNWRAKTGGGPLTMRPDFMQADHHYKGP